VKAMEERGIGRPSTYAAIIKTLKDREYVILEKRVLSPTPLGETTCDALIAAFPEVMNYQFTAQVEDWLDDVSRGERDWVQALHAFYDPFAQALQAAPAKMATFPKQPRLQTAPVTAGGTSSKKRFSRRRPSAKQPADPNVLCPKCGAPMVKRHGPRGEFWGCSKYPECKGTRNIGG
jgi:DNA topoisomerase I